MPGKKTTVDPQTYKVVSKRIGHSHLPNGLAVDTKGGVNAGVQAGLSRKTCYVTFADEQDDKMELYVSEIEYNMLTVGEKGILSFNGTRLSDFVKA